MLIILAYTLLFLSSVSLLALAQEPAPLEISIVPQAEFAVAGQPFTYTIVVTNVSQTSVNDVIVFTEIPAGTTFLATYQNNNWFVGEAQSGETKVIVWDTLEPVIPTQVVTFELVVDVLLEMVNQQLVSKEYTIANGKNGDVIVTGLPVTTQILAIPPTPTPSPTVTSTATPTITPTPTATPISTATSSPTSAILSATSSLPTEVAISETLTPTLIPTSPAGKTSSSSSVTSNILTISIIVGLIIVISCGVIGLVWFFKGK